MVDPIFNYYPLIPHDRPTPMMKLEANPLKNILHLTQSGHFDAQDAAAVAQIDQAPPAKLTVAAVNGRVEGDTIARRPTNHAVAAAVLILGPAGS